MKKLQIKPNGFNNSKIILILLTKIEIFCIEFSIINIEKLNFKKKIFSFLT